MTDLDKLIEAVEAWATIAWGLGGSPSREALPMHWHDAMNAYLGSLDAALRLHDALLPGQPWTVFGYGEAVIGTPFTTWQAASSPPSPRPAFPNAAGPPQYPAKKCRSEEDGMKAPSFKSPQNMNAQERDEYARLLAREGFTEAARYVRSMWIWL